MSGSGAINCKKILNIKFHNRTYLYSQQNKMELDEIFSLKNFLFGTIACTPFENRALFSTEDETILQEGVTLIMDVKNPLFGL